MEASRSNPEAAEPSYFCQGQSLKGARHRLRPQFGSQKMESLQSQTLFTDRSYGHLKVLFLQIVRWSGAH